MVTGSSPGKHCLPGHLANHEARVTLALPAPSWEPKYSSRKQREELASYRPLRQITAWQERRQRGQRGTLVTTRPGLSCAVWSGASYPPSVTCMWLEHQLWLSPEREQGEETVLRVGPSNAMPCCVMGSLGAACPHSSSRWEVTY